MKGDLLYTFLLFSAGILFSISAENGTTKNLKVAGNNSAAFIVNDSSQRVVVVLDSLINMYGRDKKEHVTDNMTNEETNEISLSSLDFLLGACENNGFYETGAWHTDSSYSYLTFATDFTPELYPRVRPVAGKITSAVGYRQKWKRMHLGVDFSTLVGDTVHSATDGVVNRIAFDRRGYGLFLFITDDNGIECRYAHLSRILVRHGENVIAGQPIALAGNSGFSTGPHLHFELRYKGRVVNPALFFH